MNKNEVTLQAFTKYCVTHPEQRFWQALRNWAGFHFILASSDPPAGEATYDTFSWEGKGPGKRTRKPCSE